MKILSPDLRLLAELEEFFGEGERLMGVVRTTHATVANEEGATDA